MEARYNLEKKESTIKLLNQQSLINQLRIKEQKENIKKQNTLVIFLLILIATIIIAIYFYLIVSLFHSSFITSVTVYSSPNFKFINSH